MMTQNKVNEFDDTTPNGLGEYSLEENSWL